MLLITTYVQTYLLVFRGIQCCVKFIESHYSLKTTITKHRVRRDCLRSFLQGKITHLIVVLHNQHFETLMLFKCCIDLSFLQNYNNAIIPRNHNKYQCATEQLPCPCVDITMKVFTISLFFF